MPKDGDYYSTFSMATLASYWTERREVLLSIVQSKKSSGAPGDK